MYEIYEGIKVPINRVTPKSVKKYQERLRGESSKSQEAIMETVNKELPKQLEDGSITPNGIKEIVAKAVQDQVIASLDIYADKQFFDEWLDIVFQVSNEDKAKMTDFENKFYVDEFMKGYSDFFGRLRGSSN